MPTKFTRAPLLVLGLCIGLGACSNVPLSDSDPGDPFPNPIEASGASNEAQAEPTQGADLAGQPTSTIAVPPVLPGNRELFERAKRFLQEGNESAAQVLFLDLAESQPELAGPWTNLGHIAANSGDDESARGFLERALEANPHNCEALTKLGLMARKDGLFGQAEKYYQTCLEAQPFFGPAYLNLGILYELYMGRLDEALTAYNRYQLMMAEPSRKVAGWVMDLERRVASVAKR